MAYIQSKLHRRILLEIVLPVLLGCLLSIGLSSGVFLSKAETWLDTAKAASKAEEISSLDRLTKDKADFTRETMQRAMSGLWVQHSFAQRSIRGEIPTKGAFIGEAFNTPNPTVNSPWEGDAVTYFHRRGEIKSWFPIDVHTRFPGNAQYKDVVLTDKHKPRRYGRWGQYESWALENYESLLSTGPKYDSATGRRYMDSHPTHPSDTRWYSGVPALPGFTPMTNSSVQSTADLTKDSFNRLWTASRLAAVNLPLYNHYRGIDDTIAVGIAFRADGLRSEFYGPYSDNAWNGAASRPLEWKSLDDKTHQRRKYPDPKYCPERTDPYSVCLGESRAWYSSPINRAHAAAQESVPESLGELCKPGKVGFDSRCRPWFSGPFYAPGTQTGDTANQGKPWVSSPYVFGWTGKLASSMSMRVTDNAGETVAVAALHFNTAVIDREITETKILDSGFAFVTTPAVVNGGNTVSIKDLDRSVGRMADTYIFGTDGVDDAELQAFKKIEADMSAGAVNNGGSAEYTNQGKKWLLSHAPVLVDVPMQDANGQLVKPTCDQIGYMKPCNEKLHVYSVALTVPEQDILAPFEKVEDDISAALALRITIGIGVIIGIVVVFLGGVATAISSSIVVPIKQLLHITRAINSKQLGEEMPEIRAGCSEVSIIYDTFRQLYCVIRFSNDSFFKGDLDAAFAVMDEALTLFRRLGNSKGVGVAQNNRGNILQSFYRRAVKARSKGSNQGAFTSSSAGAYSEPVTAFEAAAEAYEEAVIAAKESLRSHENPGDNPGAGKAVNIEALEAGLEAGAPVATVAVLSMRRQVANRLYNMALLFKAGAENGQAKISQVECATRAKACFEEVSAIDSRPDTHNPTRLVSILGHCAELTILLGISAGGVGGDNVRGDGAGAGAGGFDVLSKAMQLVDRAMSVAATMPVVAIDGSGQAPRSICEQRAMLARAKLAGLAGDKGAEAEGCIAALAHGSASDSLVEREAFQLLAANPSVDADARKRLTCLANPQPPKDVVFVLDVSGSMAGSRLQNAVRNLQKIFNEHCAGDDRVAFVRFNHQSEVVFSLRSMDAAHKVYQRFAESRASSTTAFRDALTDAKTMLTRALPELGQQQRKKWIVALTDGEDNQSRVSLPNMVASLKETASEIQLVTVGLAIRAGTKALAETKALCDATNDGVYISAEGAGSELDEAFAKVADMLAEPSLVVETF